MGFGAGARFTVQSVAAMLRRLGATIDPEAIQTRNAAAVMVTATLPPLANPGTRIDVVVSSLGNARSLQGGTLLLTPLYGPDKNVYATAQGPLLVGGFSSRGRTGSNVQYNHTTAGRVPDGGIVERRPPLPKFAKGKPVTLALRDPSFVTAQRIVESINTELGGEIATAADSASISLTVPEEFAENPVPFLAKVNLLEVEPDTIARVVVDERTGTVVLGANVRISETAVAQGGLTVEVSESFGVSQPTPFSRRGRTAVVPETEVDAELAGER